MSEGETKAKRKRKNLPELRNIITQQKKLRVVEVFDTLGKTSGEKDVSLCETGDGDKVILRIGEIRPLEFFSGGFDGKHFIVPKVYERQESETPYEIEECLEGELVSNVDQQQSKTGKINPLIAEKLLAAFWEFQHVARDIGLEKRFDKSKILKHYEKAEPILQNSQVVLGYINQYGSFWEGTYPSKCKFATDNLIVIPDGRIGFIDNAGAGLRYFGYDLGWLLWPRWVEMETERFDKVDEHFDYLVQFMGQARSMASQGEIELNDFERKFWLVIFERLVGGVYDVARNVRHLDDWGMGQDGDKKRKEKHLAFLNGLLERVIKEL